MFSFYNVKDLNYANKQTDDKTLVFPGLLFPLSCTMWPETVCLSQKHDAGAVNLNVNKDLRDKRGTI